MGVNENLPTPLIPAHLRNVWETEVTFFLIGRKGAEVRKKLFSRHGYIPGWEEATPQKRRGLIEQLTRKCLDDIMQTVEYGSFSYLDDSTGEQKLFEFHEWRIT